MTREYRRYTKEQLEPIVAQSTSFMEVLRKLGRTPVGGNVTNLHLTLKRWDIKFDHFTGQAHAKDKPSNQRKTADEYLCMGASTDRRLLASRIRQALDEKGVTYKCNCCGISEWLGKRLILEVDHIDEQYWNNTFENLQYLCPNCHAMKNR